MRCADLLGGERRPLPDAAQRVARAIGDAAVELAVRVAIERAACGIRRVLRDAGQLERLAVVERRVPAAMLHDDRMIGRHLVEIVDVQRRACPSAWCRRGSSPSTHVPGRRLLRLRAQLLDDAGDGDELDLERIADEHLVEQRGRRRRDCGSR